MIDFNLPAWCITFVHGCVLLVFFIGMLCFFLKTSPLRQILGLKLMLQSISLGLITAGWERGKIDIPQSMVITSLVIEAVVIGLALTLIIQMNRHQRQEQAHDG
jgi:multisubunit Na+/H+ antiporter MnhC subunit